MALLLPRLPPAGVPNVFLVFALVAVYGNASLVSASTNTTCKPWELSAQSPSEYDVTFATTKGDFVVRVHRAWAPLAADRFYALALDEFFASNAFWRVVKDPVPFVVQFGVSPYPSNNFIDCELPNEPSVASNVPGTMAFGMDYLDDGSGNKTTCCRSTEIYINLGYNERLDPLNFAVFGEITSGFANVFALEGPGDGVDRVDYDRLMKEGDNYTNHHYPGIDRVVTAAVSGDSSKLCTELGGISLFAAFLSVFAVVFVCGGGVFGLCYMKWLTSKGGRRWLAKQSTFQRLSSDSMARSASLQSFDTDEGKRSIDQPRVIGVEPKAMQM